MVLRVERKIFFSCPTNERTKHYFLILSIGQTIVRSCSFAFVGQHLSIREILGKENEKLHLTSLSADVLQAIDELCQLNTFGFHVPHDLKSCEKDPVIQFKHNKDVSVIDLDREIESGNITFKQLNKPNLIVSEKLNDVWLNFIVSNNKLETFVPMWK